MKLLKEYTNQELIDEYKTYYDMINYTSYGVKDVIRLNCIEDEIERRNGTISVSTDVNFPDD